jgi:nucleoside-diphosphate-sugar epimerase
MKVFITGATGFVGSFLAESLIEKKYNVRCLVRKQSNLRWIADLDVECYYGTLSDKQSLYKGLENVDMVFHLAGLTKARTEDEYFEANYTGTKNLIDAVIKVNKKLQRFIHVSSQAAIGPSPSIIPIDENCKPNPLTYYGKSKLAGEKYVLENKDNLPITILRPPAVYGPRDTDILEFFRTVKTGIIPQLGGTDKYLSLIHVKDLVEGIIRASELKKAEGKTYFITSPKPYPWSEIAKTTLKVMNKRGFKVPVPLILMKGVALVSEGISTFTKKPALVNNQKIIEMEQDFWTCSPDRAKKDLDFEAKISLEDGIRETIAWYKENRWL